MSHNLDHFFLIKHIASILNHTEVIITSHKV